MESNRAPAWAVRLRVPAGALEAVEAALGELGGALASDLPDAAGRAAVALYLETEPDRAEVTALLAAAALAAGVAPPDVEIERLPALDWVAESRKALPAIQAGPFYVHGAHVTEPPPPGAIPLLIEAGVAFGTGRHESTCGCLLALADLAKERPVARALDMGCGSGILALAIARLWGCPVVAVDNDADAVTLCAENARLNGVADLVDPHHGEGYGCPAVARGAPYELIVANILAGPLIAMAPDLIRHLAPGGVAVLSGLLAEQESDVLASHRPLMPLRRVPLGEWVTLVLRRDE